MVRGLHRFNPARGSAFSFVSCLALNEIRTAVSRIRPHMPPRPPIVAGKLLGTKSHWLTRYRHLMDAGEFDRFVRLLMGLAPFILLLVDPQSRSRRGDRNSPVSRRNIELVLHGSPCAQPLFERDHSE
jgi:hypothetical protein